MLIETISIPFFNLSREKITQKRYILIELHDTILIVTAEYISQEKKESEDKELEGLVDPWENEALHNYTYTACRKDIASIDMVYTRVEKKYRIDIEVTGRFHTLTFYFKKESDCIDLWKKLISWAWPDEKDILTTKERARENYNYIQSPT